MTKLKIQFLRHVDYHGSWNGLHDRNGMIPFLSYNPSPLEGCHVDCDTKVIATELKPKKWQYNWLFLLYKQKILLWCGKGWNVTFNPLSWSVDKWPEHSSQDMRSIPTKQYCYWITDWQTMHSLNRCTLARDFKFGRCIL